MNPSSAILPPSKVKVKSEHETKAHFDSEKPGIKYPLDPNFEPLIEPESAHKAESALRAESEFLPESEFPLSVDFLTLLLYHAHELFLATPS